MLIFERVIRIRIMMDFEALSPFQEPMMPYILPFVKLQDIFCILNEMMWRHAGLKKQQLRKECSKNPLPDFQHRKTGGNAD
jgi:hypothetical protein